MKSGHSRGRQAYKQHQEKILERSEKQGQGKKAKEIRGHLQVGKATRVEEMQVGETFAPLKILEVWESVRTIEQGEVSEGGLKMREKKAEDDNRQRQERLDH